MSQNLLDFDIISIDGDKYEVEINSIKEFKSIIKFAGENSLPIITVPPEKPIDKGIWLYTNFNKISKIKNISNYTETGPDININEFKEILHKRGYTWNNEMYCHSPSKTLREFFQLGWGMQISPSYGKVRDTFLAGKFILPSGKIFETVKTPRSAAGPDIGRFFIGLGETLSIPILISTRIFKTPPRYNEYFISFDKYNDGIDFIRNLTNNRISMDNIIYFSNEILKNFHNINQLGNNLLFFKIPVYFENIGTAIDNIIKKSSTKGKLFNTDETISFSHKMQKSLDEFSCKRIYSSNWTNVKKIEKEPVMILSPTPEGTGIITNSNLDTKLFNLTYDSNFQNKLIFFRKKFPALFEQFLKIKTSVDPNNIFNPHLFNLEDM